MKYTSLIHGFVFSILFLSCQDHRHGHVGTPEEKIDSLKSPSKIFEINQDSIVQLLQGKWKEPVYPFRCAEFRGATVKFIEEGVPGNTDFTAFEILDTCRFATNNTRNAKPGDLFMVIDKSSRCEILHVSGEQFTFSGYNPSSNENYVILYKKEK